MKKILLASAFALFGTFATANETKSTKLSGFEIKIETVEIDGIKCCTATVTYYEVFQKSFTECSGTTATNCELVQMFAEEYVKNHGGTV